MSLILTNAIVVLPEQMVDGTVALRDGRIEDVQPGRSAAPGALDFDGDFLLPGIVDLHTDNLERQVLPRTNARWPGRAALLAHDGQCAAAGITTVLDALCLGDLGFDDDRQRTTLDGIADLDALMPTGLLKCDHRLHLRCELPAIGMPDLLDQLAFHAALTMVSLMDHTPGIGQYADLDRYRAMRRSGGDDPAMVDRRIEELAAKRGQLRDTNRARLLATLRGSTVTLASHDDRTEAEIAENIADGIGVSEFPVTRVAASAARKGGMAIIAGAPNLVRGASHNGNVAALDLLGAGLIDALASDYVPSSLVHAAFIAASQNGIGLPRAVGLVSDASARMVGLTDRGRIAPGLRADFVRVRVHQGVPVVRQVWRGGERVI
jgi:alpha-D-ribose 1-methylphosphonate 5-triphosphate diphosphatase